MKWTGRSGHSAAAFLGKAKVATARIKMIRRNLVMGDIYLTFLDQLYLSATTPVSAHRCTSFAAPH